MLLTVLSALFLLFQSHAQESKTIPSKLIEATVFFQGAELTHTADTHLVRGENLISIEGLSPYIDRNSLKVKAENGVVVSSHEYSLDYLSSARELPPAIRKMKDSIAFYQAEFEKVKIAKEINRKTIEFLQSGTEKNISGSEQGLGIDDLVKTMDYYKSKARELQIERRVLEKQESALSQSLSRLRRQQDQEAMKDSRISGVLKLTLSAPSAGHTRFTVSYVTPRASWTPFYDVNITSTDQPIVFSMKSKVSQNTTLDWDKVRLTLSTATPSNGKIAPLFSTWFLRPATQTVHRSPAPEMMMQNTYSNDTQEIIMVEFGEQVIGRSSRTGSASATSKNRPLYIVDGVAMDDISHIDQSMIKSTEVLKDASAKSLYGSKAEDGVVIVTLRSGMEDFITAGENELNVSYNIDLPYTIPGNGKEQTIDLQTHSAQAEYKYYCAPKLDQETFLLAEIADKHELGLLNGMANVTYDGTYIGETHIDASSTQPKMILTLGTDKRIAVKRELLRDFSSSRTLGSDIQQVFTYQITVKNNQNKPIKMVLKDQHPVSTEKNIVVDLRKETTPWTTHVEATGVVSWEDQFAPGETKIYRISYSVKYPKSVALNL